MNLIERMETSITVGFDYSTVPADVAEEARAVVARVRERNRAAVIDTGRDLLAIKERLEHGQFLTWIEAEFGMTDRTAQNYMRAASEFGDKSETVSYLPSATIYKLAAPSTPAPVREEIVRRLQAGEHLAPTSVKRMVQEAKEADRVAKEKARKEAEWAKLSDEERKALLTKEKRQRRSKDQREAEIARKREADRLERERQEAAAEEAAALIKTALGKDYERFLDLVEAAGWQFGSRIRDLARARHIPRPTALGEPNPKLAPCTPKRRAIARPLSREAIAAAADRAEKGRSTL